VLHSRFVVLPVFQRKTKFF